MSKSGRRLLANCSDKRIRMIDVAKNVVEREFAELVGSSMLCALMCCYKLFFSFSFSF
jgi:hypothetical protein